MVPWWVVALVAVWVLLVVGYTVLLWANAAHRVDPDGAAERRRL